MDDEILTPQELYEWMKITRSTAWKWRKKGMPYLGSGKAMRYKKADVLKWLEERKFDPESEQGQK